MNTQTLLHFLRRFRLTKIYPVMVSMKCYQSNSQFNLIRSKAPLNIDRTLSGKLLLSAGILSMFSKDEETPEDKLINTIKMSILCIQKGWLGCWSFAMSL